MAKRKKLQLPAGLASKVIKVIPSDKGALDKCIIREIENCIISSTDKDDCLKKIEDLSKQHLWRIE